MYYTVYVGYCNGVGIEVDNLFFYDWYRPIEVLNVF